MACKAASHSRASNCNIRKSARVALLGIVTACSLAFFSTAARADSSDSLKTIDNPGGGQVVYGSLTNITTQRDAMAAMLRNIHGHFGDKPQIGKFFQARGSESIATFFTLTAKKQGGKPVAGMVIVSVPPGAQSGVAAVLYDDADRFAKTEPAMMQALNQAWHRESPQPASHGSASGGNIGDGPGGVFGVNIQPDQSRSETLHFAQVSDNSASIGLPAGWQISGGGGGSLHAVGPHGESIHMGVLFQNNYDPQTPQGANMINYLRRGSTPFTACSMTENLIQDYLCVTTQNRARQHLPPVSVHVLSSRLAPDNALQGAFLAETDFADGKGVSLSSLRLGAQRMGPGTWILTLGAAVCPKNLAEEEWPTMQAMIMSYRQNQAVIQQQTQQVIAQINARADANRKLAQARSDASDAHNKQVEETWDAQSQENKAFENYTLDRSVVRDNEVPAHGTFNNPTADWLVKSDPNRYQYVSTQDLLKGVDY